MSLTQTFLKFKVGSVKEFDSIKEEINNPKLNSMILVDELNHEYQAKVEQLKALEQKLEEIKLKKQD